MVIYSIGFHYGEYDMCFERYNTIYHELKSFYDGFIHNKLLDILHLNEANKADWIKYAFEIIEHLNYEINLGDVILYVVDGGLKYVYYHNLRNNW